MNNNQPQWIKDLQDLETSYSPQTNFDEVMNRRKKKRRGFIWWTTRSSVLLLIGFGSAYAYFSTPAQNTTTKIKSNVSSITNTSSSSTTSSKSALSDKASTSLNSISSVPAKVESFEKSKTLGLTSNSQSSKTSSLRVQTKNRTRNQRETQPQTIALIPSTSQEIESNTADKSTSIPTETLQEVQQRIAQIFNGKNRLSRTNIASWKTIPSDVDWIDLDLKEPEIKLRPGKLPWFVEFSAITGSNTQIDFDNQQNLSILGTQYIAQYQGSLLREFQNATMWGLGISYTEWVGNGQWRNIEETITKTFDSTLMDSVLTSKFNTTTGMINYRIDKISLPVQFRFHTQILKLPIRLGAQLAPGITTLTEGNYFTETSFAPINRQRNFSFDGKLTVGPMIPITDQFTIIIEPSLVFQSFRGPNNQWNAKSFTGLGIGMMWSIN
ncbi:MAG: hypothetical protein NBV77_02580 [Bacteroidia bacterium]|nr:hypothetical protein [Bacteroidia bacterium]